MIKISIILPIYNVAQYLPKCIDLVLNQTLADIEVILATDGSEGCDVICNEYAKNDKRVKVISHPGGYGKSVNQGIDMASGKYIGIVETDDWCDLRMFEKLYRAVKQYDADVAKGSFYCVKKRRLKKKNFSKETRLLALDKDGIFFYFMPSLWSAIYKKSFLKNNHITSIEERLSYIDTPFVLETFIKANRFVYLPDIVCGYNCNNPDSSTNNTEKAVDSIRAEEFFYNKFDAETFKHIKKQYLVPSAPRIKWHLEQRISSEENKCLFGKIAHESVRKIGISDTDLSLFQDENFKQFLLFIYQTDKYDDYKSFYIQKGFKLLGVALIRKETIVWEKQRYDIWVSFHFITSGESVGRMCINYLIFYQYIKQEGK